MMTERVLEYARTRFIDHMADLLDDPSDLVYPWRDQEPSEVIAELRTLAVDLNLDFDQVMAASGSEYEVNRLVLLEQNKLSNGTPVKPKLGTMAEWAKTHALQNPRAVFQPNGVVGETDA